MFFTTAINSSSYIIGAMSLFTFDSTSGTFDSTTTILSYQGAAVSTATMWPEGGPVKNFSLKQSEAVPLT